MIVNHEISRFARKKETTGMAEQGDGRGAGLGVGVHPSPVSIFCQISSPYLYRVTDYAHRITTCTPRFSDLPPSLEKKLEAEASEEEQNLNSPLNI